MELSKVKNRKTNDIESIMILEDLNYIISEDFLDKWQSLLNLIAEIYSVPSALIMRVHEDKIEVFSRSSNTENPYPINESETLGIGLYCETVLATDHELEVHNALESDIWKDNPDVEIDMIYYYGLPIKWSSGEFFGTICILDSKTRHLDLINKQLFNEFKVTVEQDLELIMKYHELKIAKERHEVYHELLIEHDRHKTLDSFYSSLTHEINTPIGIAKVTASYIANRVASLNDFSEENRQKTLETVKKIEEATVMMTSSIENASEIILLAKNNFYETSIETRKMVNLESYIRSIMMSMKYELKKLDVEYELISNSPIEIETIPRLISQIIHNLVSNSMKHGFEINRSNVITIELMSDEDNCYIQYSDNGIGVDEAIQSEIFKPLFRGTTNVEGSGMGLTIVDEIVVNKLHGGIQLNENKRNGFEIRINLPKE